MLVDFICCSLFFFVDKEANVSSNVSDASNISNEEPSSGAADCREFEATLDSIIVDGQKLVEDSKDFMDTLMNDPIPSKKRGHAEIDDSTNKHDDANIK